MSTEARGNPNAGVPTTWQEGDHWMRGESVCDLLDITRDELYKLNARGAFRVYRWGKENRYLYSNVQNWMNNQDTDIKGRPDLQKELPLSELPNCWPPKKREQRPKRKPRGGKREEEPTA